VGQELGRFDGTGSPKNQSGSKHGSKAYAKVGSGCHAKLLPDGTFSQVQLESQVQTRLKGDRKAKLEILANWLHLLTTSRLGI
jgi:hypothetical protein